MWMYKESWKEYSYYDDETNDRIGSLSQKESGGKWRFWRRGCVLSTRWDDLETAKLELDRIFQSKNI